VPAISLSRRQALVLAASVAAILFFAGKLLLGDDGRQTTMPPLPAPTTPSSTAPRARLIVDVVGAVRRPGLYRLAEGSRIADAVSRAGGTTPRADLDSVNLAAPLADGEQVVVPRKITGAGAAASRTVPRAAATAGPVSLSTATLDELDALPGVGPVTAEKILDYRTEHGAFRSVDELDAVPGIGPARLDELRDLVVP
jgi:competence protein ComEA